MEIDNDNYFAHAAADDEYFSADYSEGKRFPGMAALGHIICERYLKHIIDVYAQPDTPGEGARKSAALHDRSLRRILRYIEGDMGIHVDRNLKTDVYAISDFHISTMYPGESSFIATPEDIEYAAQALESVRAFVCEYTREQGMFSVKDNSDEIEL